MKYVKIKIGFIIFILLCIGFGCKNNPDKKSASEEKGVAAKSTNSSLKDTSVLKRNTFLLENFNRLDSLKNLRNELLRNKLYKINSVVLLSFDKSNDSVSSKGEDFRNKCDKWVLDKKTVEKLIKIAKPLNGTEWDILYDVLPCYYYGKVEINEKELSYKINAGSFIIVYNSDTTFYYGITEKKFEKYFLSSVWNPKSEK